MAKSILSGGREYGCLHTYYRADVDWLLAGLYRPFIFLHSADTSLKGMPLGVKYFTQNTLLFPITIPYADCRYFNINSK